MWTGERQTTKMRIKYLEAALNQDIQYFDTEVRTSDVVFAINTDAVMVQDAISEKVKQNPEMPDWVLMWYWTNKFACLLCSWVTSSTIWPLLSPGSWWVLLLCGN